MSFIQDEKGRFKTIYERERAIKEKHRRLQYYKTILELDAIRVPTDLRKEKELNTNFTLDCPINYPLKYMRE